MLLSIDRMKISSYINCLSDHFKDRKLVDSITFLIASKERYNLEFFAPSGDYVGYFDKLEDINGECTQYVKIFSSYNNNTIKDTSVKLWYYYAGKEWMNFFNEEKKLLHELGIALPL